MWVALNALVNLARFTWLLLLSGIFFILAGFTLSSLLSGIFFVLERLLFSVALLQALLDLGGIVV